jgi:hypothetical protein
LGFGVCGYGVWGLGFGVWGLGFGVQGLVFGVGVWGLGFGVWSLGLGAWGWEVRGDAPVSEQVHHLVCHLLAIGAFGKRSI